MALALAAFLVIHGAIHVGFLCGADWPFEPGDPWLVTSLGLAPGGVQDAGAVLAIVAFLAFLLAAPTVVGVPPARLWRPLVAIGSVASAILLVVFVTPWTLPGIAIDVVLLWTAVVRGRRPAPILRRRAARGPEAGRPVTPGPEPTTMTWLAMGGR
jgi:hypothetical protein